MGRCLALAAAAVRAQRGTQKRCPRAGQMRPSRGSRTTGSPLGNDMERATQAARAAGGEYYRLGWALAMGCRRKIVSVVA